MVPAPGVFGKAPFTKRTWRLYLIEMTNFRAITAVQVFLDSNYDHLAYCVA
jgi:hypothetical protein